MNSSQGCSSEEIERKRQLALQRRRESLLRTQTLSKYNTSLTHNKQNILHTNETEYPKRIDHFSTFKAKQQNISESTSERFNPIKAQTFFGKSNDVIFTCYMKSETTFIVHMSRFYPEIIDTFKTIPSKEYDVQSKLWSFHIKDYDTLIEKLMKSGMKVKGIPANVLQIFKKNLKTSVPEIDLSCIDPVLLNALLPFQKEGVRYGISKKGRCIIADDMGLGKTIQALGIAAYYQQNWPLLIVTPSSMRYQWSDAIYRFLPSIPAHYIFQFTNSKDSIEEGKIVIVTYDLLVRALKTFQNLFFGFLILDESHILKNHKTARFNAVQTMASTAGHVVLLSGTPALSRPIELFSQINLINPKFMSMINFGVRYCDAKRSSFGWDYSGYSNIGELQLLLTSFCMIRRLKSNVLEELPEKIRQVIILDPVLIKAGDKDVQEYSEKVSKPSLTGLEKHSLLLQYYNESSMKKVKAVCDYIEGLLEKKQKFLVYAHHQNVLDAINQLIDSKKIKYIRIDGNTKPEQRKFFVDKFQSQNDCLVAILSITAANSGITLTASQLVVFAELYWNPGILSQAENRVHRIGQNNSVLIQYLIAQNTIDDVLWKMIQKKMDVLNGMGLDDNFSLNQINVTEQETKPKGQLSLDSFVFSSQESRNSETENISSKEKEFQKLLEIDEDLFNGNDFFDC